MQATPSTLLQAGSLKQVEMPVCRISNTDTPIPAQFTSPNEPFAESDHKATASKQLRTSQPCPTQVSLVPQPTCF